MISNRVFLFTGVIVLTLFACGGTNGNEGGESGLKNSPIPTLDRHVESLDQLLHETSGLIHYNRKLWTINDSGNDPVLMALDYETGQILQGVRIENAENNDWESLAQDDEFIYICDVGNNNGHREELTIYKVAKNSIPDSGSVLLNAEIIKYSYAGRSENNNPLKRSSYDCEAAFVYGDMLYLFTKDWESLTSTLYTCPTIPGIYEIEARKTYPVNGLITGADMNPESGSVILCGYREGIPFVLLYTDFNPENYSPGESLRFEFPEFMNMQNEGVAFVSPERAKLSEGNLNDSPERVVSSGGKVNVSPERAIISCERSQYPAGLYRIDLPIN